MKQTSIGVWALALVWGCGEADRTAVAGHAHDPDVRTDEAAVLPPNSSGAPGSGGSGAGGGSSNGLSTGSSGATIATPDTGVDRSGAGTAGAGASAADLDASSPEASNPETSTPETSTPDATSQGGAGAELDACGEGTFRCEGRLIARCNAERSGFELLRDCFSTAACDRAATACNEGACPDQRIGCKTAELVADGTGAFAVSTGSGHSCVVLGGGAVRCWGRNNQGQLGYGPLESGPNVGDDEVPALAGDIDLGAAAVQVVAGGAHTCALLDTGEVRCWGDSGAGKLGSGDYVRLRDTAEAEGRSADVGDDESARYAVTVALDGTAIQLAAGNNFTCALLEDGRVRCWGSNTSGNIRNTGLLGVPHYEGNIGDDEALDSRLVPAVDLGGPAAFIASGGQHTCAILRNGNVRCFGSGLAGKLGYGTFGVPGGKIIGDDETPATAGDVAIDGRAVWISAGPSHTCAVLDGGSLRCWGAGISRALGYDDLLDIGDDEPPSSRAALDLGQPVTQVSAAMEHTCALLQNGAVRCWGANRSGRLGDPNLSGAGALSRVALEIDLGHSAVAIDSEAEHTCAVLSDGQVICWGENAGAAGVLGHARSDNFNIGDDETPPQYGPVPVLEVPPRDSASIPDASAPDSDPTLDPDLPPTADAAPTADAGVPSPIRSFSTGDEHACAVSEAGSVRCWGSNEDGKLGYANTLSQPFIGDDESPASAGDVNVGGIAVGVAVGRRHSCALLEGGVVRCWGSIRDGRLGLGNTATLEQTLNIGDDETPDSVEPVDLGAPALQIAAGDHFTCALLDTGHVRCWGDGTSRRLGITGPIRDIGDDELPRDGPAVELGDQALFIDAGGAHACAVLIDGRVRCWGNSSAKLGHGATLNMINDDNPLPPGSVQLGERALRVSVGEGHVCALLADRNVRCWGGNSYGELGVEGPTLGGREVPTAQPALDFSKPVLDVSAGSDHTCVLFDDGDVQCWGRNQHGQLGNGLGSTERVLLGAAPARVDLGFPSIQLDSTGEFTCALTAPARELVCFGRGDSGQLGYGPLVGLSDVGDDEIPSSAGPVPLF